MNSRYSISEIAAIIKGEILSDQFNDQIINELLIDSRRIIKVDCTLFFALITRRNDGHKFIPELYKAGIRNFVVSYSPDDISDYPGSCFILVKDTLSALQLLALTYRKKFNIPVIGITGSNGKTIVKEWLFQLINPDQNVVRSPKSFNSQIGVPLSVWLLEPDSGLGIFEAGISEPDEMEKLQQIIKPDIGIFTNIGDAHNENFINKKQKAGEKLKLFTHVKTLIYCKDYPEIQEVIIQSHLKDSVGFFSWSRKHPADLLIRKVEKNGANHSLIKATFQNKQVSIEIPFTDEASVENAIHCWAYMLLKEYPEEVIQKRMMGLSPVAMRLELKEGINNCSVINDSYNSDIVSLTIALDFLRQQSQHTKKTIILSDILQTGKNEIYLYSKVGELLADRNIDRIIGIGPSISRQADKFKMEKSFFQTTDDFLRFFPFSGFQNETILLKGARVFEFELISQALQHKAHETVLEINLNALVHNLNYYRSLLKPETKIMVMVKAFSYGSGSFEIANILQFHNVDYLTVAYADEGVELRRAGITLPIMVMNPDAESFDTMLVHNLEPEIYSFRALEQLENAVRRNPNHFEKALKIHIKFDTGMKRLGFEEEDTARLIDHLKASKYILVSSAFTHLAGSENPKLDEFTRRQIEIFSRMFDKLQMALNYPILRHVLNTAGIVRHSYAQFDMVRLGIGLYGIPSTDEDADQLENVSTLKTIISQIKKIKPGDTVGYGREGVAETNMITATLPIGYADGLSRRLSNGNGYVMISGKRAPFFGNICMDMCMVDITGIEASEGDAAIVFGKENSIVGLAKQMGTIPYEILTSVSQRVKRVFYHD